MTIRFAAAARRGYTATVARHLDAKAPLRSANDNYVGLSGDKVLKAALRHFAEHGLAAAERARDNAERAFFHGDRRAYRWWLAICHTLDRRMASAVSAQGFAANDAAALPDPGNPAGNLA